MSGWVLVPCYPLASAAGITVRCNLAQLRQFHAHWLSPDGAEEWTTLVSPDPSVPLVDPDEAPQVAERRVAFAEGG